MRGKQTSRTTNNAGLQTHHQLRATPPQADSPSAISSPYFLQLVPPFAFSPSAISLIRSALILPKIPTTFSSAPAGFALPFPPPLAAAIAPASTSKAFQSSYSEMTSCTISRTRVWSTASEERNGMASVLPPVGGLWERVEAAGVGGWRENAR